MTIEDKKAYTLYAVFMAIVLVIAVRVSDANAETWQEWVANRKAEIAAVKEQRETEACKLKAISLHSALLGLQETWTDWKAGDISEDVLISWAKLSRDRLQTYLGECRWTEGYNGTLYRELKELIELLEGRR